MFYVLASAGVLKAPGLGETYSAATHQARKGLWIQGGSPDSAVITRYETVAELWNALAGARHDPELLTVKQAAEHLGCSDQTVRDRIERGELPYFETKQGEKRSFFLPAATIRGLQPVG